MKIGFLIGRIIVGLFYLYESIGHFTNVTQMAQYAKYKGVPLPEVSVVVTGILLLVAGATFLLGIYTEIGVISLVVFYIPVTIMMHNFWVETEAQARMMSMIGFVKNFALMGSALMFLKIEKPWPFSISKPKS